MYDQQFFDDHKGGARSSAQVIMPAVLKLCLPRAIHSVVDVGCGLGTWLRVCRESGVPETLGIDGDYVDRASLEIPASSFLSHNLNLPVEFDRSFDLVISLEVAEHLPRDAANKFVQTLTRLAPIVLFSAAIPGQGGEHHINEQWPDYWADLFAKYHHVGIDCLRFSLLGDRRVEFWYQQNTLIFAAFDRLADYPDLAHEYWRTGGRIASLVHPSVLERWKNWGMSQSAAYWELVSRNRGPAAG
jgi:SAM-dependent methyltransferase